MTNSRQYAAVQRKRRDSMKTTQNALSEHLTERAVYMCSEATSNNGYRRQRRVLMMDDAPEAPPTKVNRLHKGVMVEYERKPRRKYAANAGLKLRLPPMYSESHSRSSVAQMWANYSYTEGVSWKVNEELVKIRHFVNSSYV